MTVVLSDADGTPLGTLIGARGPEPAGDPNAKAFVSRVGSGIVYVVKPFVYDRIDKKRTDFRDGPKPSPGTTPAGGGAAPGAAGIGAGAVIQGGEGTEGADVSGDEGEFGLLPGLLPGIQGDAHGAAVGGGEGHGEKMIRQPLGPAFGELRGGGFQGQGRRGVKPGQAAHETAEPGGVGGILRHRYQTGGGGKAPLSSKRTRLGPRDPTCR